MKLHTYDVLVRWTGNRGVGTADYTGYDRSHDIWIGEKPPILASSDPAFRGNPSRYNPEELLVASLSSCHMLWYLHLCADAGVVIDGYRDRATGRMEDAGSAGGRFVEVVLQPTVSLRRLGDRERAAALHTEAHARCFIASSVNFPVRCEPAFFPPRSGGHS